MVSKYTVKLILTIIFFVFQFSAFSQTVDIKDIKKNSCSCKDENEVKNYFENQAEQDKFIEKCLIETEEYRLQLNLPNPGKISHLNSIAISLVKPYYPNLAKQLRISGEVLVEVLADENGNAIYAKVLKGRGLFAESVKRAICNSKFTPQMYCQKLVKMRHIIKYNFILN